MFKDTKDGQTHSQNDGCGEPAHNKTKKEKPIPSALVNNPLFEKSHKNPKGFSGDEILELGIISRKQFDYLVNKIYG